MKMIKKITALVCAFAIVFAMVMPMTAYAYGLNSFIDLGVADDNCHVFDGADFYSEEEEEKLEKRCREISKEFDTDVVIATINGYSGYIEDAVKEIERERYGRVDGACANMLIVDIGSRDIRVECIEGPKGNDNWMESGLCNYIYEEIQPSFTKGKYYNGTDEYLDLLEKYLPAKSGYNPNSIWYNPLFHLAAAIIISAIIVATQVAGAGGKVTVTERDYLQLGADHKIDKKDIFLRKTISKTRIQSSSGGGGRSGGGGGGRGGGGGKF